MQLDSIEKTCHSGHSVTWDVGGCRMIYAGVLSFLGLGLEDRQVPTFWPLLWRVHLPKCEGIWSQATWTLRDGEARQGSRRVALSP